MFRKCFQTSFKACKIFIDDEKVIFGFENEKTLIKDEENRKYG